MVIDKDTILYFSGTGNSLQVAKDIKSEISDFNLCRIDSLMTEEKIRIKGNILGIVFPVIYSRMPSIVETIIKRLEISKDTYVFAVATHGGAPAEALIKLRRIMQGKGAALNSGFLIKMPTSNIFAFNVASVKKQTKLFEREKKKLSEISRIIKQRKNHKCEVSTLLIDTLMDRVFAKTMDRIVKQLPIRDKEFWALNNCNGCRLCEKICPVNNIELSSDRPVWKHNCEQCAACIQHCPKEAIQWGSKTLKRKRYRNPNINISELIR
ncbi:MAG: EFR1 family ferrodoxin [Bacillota bacterium]|nr:EFR1 family ferrodoxin [Bacillota bacterium]